MCTQFHRQKLRARTRKVYLNLSGFDDYENRERRELLNNAISKTVLAITCQLHFTEE